MFNVFNNYKFYLIYFLGALCMLLEYIYFKKTTFKHSLYLVISMKFQLSLTVHHCCRSKDGKLM